MTTNRRQAREPPPRPTHRPASRGRAPRWRCGEPDCPAHRWQPVIAHGEYDPVDVALGDLEAHWATHHTPHPQPQPERTP
jgi:hypothetical protein